MKDKRLVKRYKENGEEKILFCFPYAGGGATAYNGWIQKLKNYMGVCPIQLPGREDRIAESAYTEMSVLVQDLADTLEEFIGRKECYFFGHSMGGKIAYETALELLRRGKKIEHLFISGCEAPHIPIKNPIFHLPNEDFAREIIKFEGTPKELVQNYELFQFFMPLLRADFTLVETYTADECHPLECPISAFYGDEDQEAQYADVSLWKEYTRQKFKIEAFSGGHFFIKSQEESILSRILDVI